MGWRDAVASVTNLPLMADRWWAPELLLRPLSVTVVRGCRAAVAFETYRPVMALRA